MGSHRRGLVLLAALAAVAATAPAAEAARPNLVTTKLANPPKTAVVGGKFRVKETVANRVGRAGKSDSQFHLSANRKLGLEDLLMLGARKVPALRGGESSPGPRRGVKATVPVGTPIGRYFLFACADDRDRVRESKEGDNCRRSRRKVRIVGPLKTPLYRVDAFSDFARLQPVEDDPATFMRGIWCRPTERVKMPSLDAAMASVKRKLSEKSGSDGYAAFKRSADYKSAARSEKAAGAAFAVGQPGAALAAMVRAHELQQQETSHVVNAAALATAVGMPNEALAMLDAAPALTDKDRPPMGISRQAILLENRAHALAALGRFGEAETAANSAAGIDPFLTEAEGTAGVAALCAGKAAGVPRIRKARKRQPDKPPTDEPGKESALRNLPFPSTPEQAVSIWDFYKSESDGQLGELMARNEKRTQLSQQAFGPQVEEMTRRQRQRLLYAVSFAASDPDLEKKRQEMAPFLNGAHEAYRKYWCDGDSCHDEEWQKIVASCSDQQCVRERCVPAAKGWHQEWLNYNSQAYQKGAAYFRAASKRMSAVAAQIKNPATYQLALLEIEDLESSLYSGILQPAYYWTDWVRRAEEDCVGSLEPPPSTAGTDPTAAQGPGPCPPFVKGINAKIEFGDVSLSINCEEIQLGGSLGAGWIKGFGEVTYDFKAGKITVFAGSQGEVGAGPLKADFKSGIYVTATQQGFEDVGWRVGPSYTVGNGPATFSQSDTMDMSFVGAFAFTDAL